MNKKIHVCVAWPYAAGDRHIGHLAGAYLPPDIFARYHRLLGNEVLVVSGSDTHGTPITVRAEQDGLDSVFISDHFQPWRHNDGHAPFAMSWLAAAAERTERVTLGTSVMTPTFRYNPAVVAQAFGTLGVLNPGRIVLGIGTGEALNEVAVGAAGSPWPDFKERFARLREAVTLIRRLWTGQRVTHRGRCQYRVQDCPDGIAGAGGPCARHGDRGLGQSPAHPVARSARKSDRLGRAVEAVPSQVGGGRRHPGRELDSGGPANRRPVRGHASFP